MAGAPGRGGPPVLATGTSCRAHTVPGSLWRWLITSVRSLFSYVNGSIVPARRVTVNQHPLSVRHTSMREKGTDGTPIDSPTVLSYTVSVPTAHRRCPIQISPTFDVIPNRLQEQLNSLTGRCPVLRYSRWERLRCNERTAIT